MGYFKALDGEDIGEVVHVYEFDFLDANGVYTWWL
jgi:hypothetical protein